MTNRIRISVLGLFAALAVLAAGCGGGGTQKGGASTSPGASLVTAHALAYVTVQSDLGSNQWKQVDELSHKFPGRDKAIEQIKKSLSQQNVDYTADIKPALGSEVDFAVVNGATPKDSKSARTSGAAEPDPAACFFPPQPAARRAKAAKRASARAEDLRMLIPVSAGGPSTLKPTRSAPSRQAPGTHPP